MPINVLLSLWPQTDAVLFSKPTSTQLGTHLCGKPRTKIYFLSQIFTHLYFCTFQKKREKNQNPTRMIMSEKIDNAITAPSQTDTNIIELSRLSGRPFCDCDLMTLVLSLSSHLTPAPPLRPNRFFVIMALASPGNKNHRTR